MNTSSLRVSTETFAIPCVGAIIHREIDGQSQILIQERQKKSGGIENGMLEVPAGKVREYENIFDALRREVREETGLSLLNIQGENEQTVRTVNGYKVMSFTSFCTTQNLSGGYSIILQTFLCQAEGEMLRSSSEAQDIRWVSTEECKAQLQNSPADFYPLHINALMKYLDAH
ncbi:NUDIX domain-containing protein [Deinococcus detaillensis]|uniref:NUDIX domain-containing protein n=1 Tax=Deinococcus detaillensis TaxID=2592048 RepID=A0A553USH4_9DEIO|nr:NUDIX domain-containing protein [Deinococcus detaillensis]TSA83167.1 NUDIX domain-containing protein [Deinococcus detaillensis]